jgi:hypothetical protein
MANKETLFKLSRKSKILGLTVMVGGLSTYQYKRIRIQNPQAVENGIWRPFQQKVFPMLKNTIVSYFNSFERLES